jgi:hypothetical protein
MQRESAVSERPFVHWQGRTIAQFTLAIGLISGWSVALLALGVTLLKDGCFRPSHCIRMLLIASMASLAFSAMLSGAAVVTRTLDFRLTMRKARREEEPAYSKSLVIFGFNKEAYGNMTWGLFWMSLAAFGLASTVFLVTLGIYLISPPEVCS